MSGTISAVIARAVVDMLEGAGADTQQLLRELELSRELLDTPEARISAASTFALLERAPALLDDDLFCLRAARDVPPGALEVFDFVTRASATLGEALERCARYFAMIDDRTELSIERQGDIARLVGKNRGTPIAPRPATELLFGMALGRGEQIIGKRWELLEVSFLQPGPADPSGHEEFFGAPVRFSQTRDELVFRSDYLDEPSVARDPALAEFFDRLAQSYLERMSGPTSIVNSARKVITEELRGSEPTLARTAKRLAMSERTLQRRLREASCTHFELVEEVRRDLALELLRDRGIPIAELGYQLGFSDPSAFYRAFKRWTGATPADYRRAP